MKPNELEKWIKISISIVMALTTVVFIFGILSYFYFTYGLPSIDTLRNYKPSTITRFYAHDGELIGEFLEKRRSSP
jgi:penicillin-binding protein 1A